MIMEEYIVENGDTLQRLAVKFNCTPSHLASENKLSHFQSVLFPGQKLKIPKVDTTTITDTVSANRISLRTTHKSHPGTATRISAPLPSARSYSSESELDEITEKQFVKFKATRVVNSSKNPCPGTLLITPKFLVFDPERKNLDFDKDEVINNAEPVCNVGLYICLESVYSLNTFSKLTEVIDEQEILKKEMINDMSNESTDLEDYLYLIVKATPLSDAYNGPPIATLKFFTRQPKGSKIFIFGIPKDRIEEAYSFLIISGIGSGPYNKPKENYDDQIEDKSAEDSGNHDLQTVRSYETSFICKYNHFKKEEFDNSFEYGMSWEVIETSQVSIVADALKEFEEEKFKPQLHNGTSEILTDSMIVELSASLPSNLAGSNLFLVYQTGTHGYSLGTIYRKMKATHSPTLLLIKDNSNTIFGAYMPDNFHISTHYYGTGETFVFHWKPNFKKFEWTRENNFFMKGDRDCFAIGARSGHSAIWFEDTLKYGRSEPTDTFENPTLCGNCNDVDRSNAETTINLLSINKSNTVNDCQSENPQSKNIYFVISCLEVWRFAM